MLRSSETTQLPPRASLINSREEKFVPPTEKDRARVQAPFRPDERFRA